MQFTGKAIVEAAAAPLYVRASCTEEALACLAEGSFEVLCGGTDFYPGHIDRPLPPLVLDVSEVAALRRIEELPTGWRIGAAVTWAEILEHPLPRGFDGLKAAAREIGGVQIQNTGSIGGNVCNASPAADGIVALLTLNASVRLESVAGSRTLPLSEFLLGSRRTARLREELVTAIEIPRFGTGARATFKKLGHRRYLVISVAMVGAFVELDEMGRISHAAIAVGACSARAQRLPLLESKLLGQPLQSSLPSLLDEADLAGLTPQDDVRGTAVFRLDAVASLVRRSLLELLR
jgi:CO/xanthine dehydrogenase FAD-binding subunit